MFLFIEANVGCGKSSSLDRLKKLGYITVQEPVKLWDKHLEASYGPNSAEWGLPMQLMALITRMEDLLRHAGAADGAVVVVERSLESDKIFADDLSPADREIYDSIVRRYERLMPRVPSMHLYLRASPQTCMARVRRRRRSQEAMLGLETLVKLHDRHEAAFSAVETIDAERPLADVVGDIEAVIARVSPRPESTPP